MYEAACCLLPAPCHPSASWPPPNCPRDRTTGKATIPNPQSPGRQPVSALPHSETCHGSTTTSNTNMAAAARCRMSACIFGPPVTTSTDIAFSSKKRPHRHHRGEGEKGEPWKKLGRGRQTTDSSLPSSSPRTNYFPIRELAPHEA